MQLKTSGNTKEEKLFREGGEWRDPLQQMLLRDHVGWEQKGLLCLATRLLPVILVRAGHRHQICVVEEWVAIEKQCRPPWGSLAAKRRDGVRPWGFIKYVSWTWLDANRKEPIVSVKLKKEETRHHHQISWEGGWGWNMEEQWGRICLSWAEQRPLHANRRTRW